MIKSYCNLLREISHHINTVTGVPRHARLSFIIALSVLTLLGGDKSAFARQAQHTGLRAAVLTVDITPETSKYLSGYGPRKSTGVHDRIFHKIVVIDDGHKQFYLVSTDISVTAPDIYDRVAAQLRQQLGIDPVDFWWSFTHTHSAPEVGHPGLSKVFMGERYDHDPDTAYTLSIIEKLIEGVTEVRKHLEPVRLGVGWGYSSANINRRAVDTNGLASLGMNPDGPIDRRIGLIRLEKPDGTPLVLIANYPIHGTVLGSASLEISGDVPGIVSQYVADKIGAPVLFINGAAGNIAPIYSTRSNPKSGHLSQFNVLLGDKILEANRNISLLADSIRLFTGGITVTTPRKEGLAWPDELKKYSREGRNNKNQVLLPIRFLGLGNDIAIWSAPLELFCEISNYVRDQSPFPYTFYYGYTNGWLGYLPSKEEFKYKGYEVDVVCAFTPDAEKHLTDSVLGYLEAELRSAVVSPPERQSQTHRKKKR